MEKYIIVDERIPTSCLKELTRLGFSCITLPPAGLLPEALGSHTDIVMFRHGNTIISSTEYAAQYPELFKKIESALPRYRIRLTSEVFGSSYPNDALFNALVIGDRLFCKTDSVCREILAYADGVGLRAVNVKQGYPACTVLPLSDGCAITSDRGMARAMTDEGIRVLTIPECDRIVLPPYKSGFIGGSAGKFGDTVYFAGNAKALPFFDKIDTFAKEAGVSLISLDEKSELLFDLGGLAFCK